MPITGTQSQDFPKRLFSVLVGAAILLLLAMLALAWHSHDHVSQAVQRAQTLAGLHEEIVLYDEILTMSASMAAATGDRAWVTRYENHEPKLSRALQSAIALSSDDTLAQAIARVDDANNGLVELERQSFAAVHGGDAEHAWRLLSGKRYRALKQVYADGMREASRVIRGDITTTERFVRQRLLLSFFSTGVVLVALIAIWVIGWRLLRHWRRTQQQLLSQNLEARERAERASQAKSDFLDRMSHELRTPMHAIMAFTALAQKRAHDETLQRHLGRIAISGRRLSDLLDDLLEQSLNPQATSPGRFVEHDLATLIDGVIHDHEQRLAAARMLISSHSPRPLICSVDPAAIRTLIANLLDNAMAFGGPDDNISIEAQHVAGDDTPDALDRVRITVRDQGIGIPEDELERVFEAFVHSTRSVSADEGIGMGLTVANEIVRLHRGTIHAVSPPPGHAQGTAVVVEIPCKPSQDAAPEAAPA